MCCTLKLLMHEPAIVFIGFRCSGNFFIQYTVLNEEHIIPQKTIFCVTPKRVRKVNTAFCNTQADDGK